MFSTFFWGLNFFPFWKMFPLKRKNNSIEISHVILTDRNNRNAKIIQATPQNSHIIKLIPNFCFVLSFLTFYSVFHSSFCMWYNNLRLACCFFVFMEIKAFKFKHIDVTSTTIIKSCCPIHCIAFIFKASHGNYSAFGESRKIFLLPSWHFWASVSLCSE